MPFPTRACSFFISGKSEDGLSVVLGFILGTVQYRVSYVNSYGTFEANKEVFRLPGNFKRRITYLWPYETGVSDVAVF